MKPLNLDNKPCSPTSSNCVIWSGRNLPCINLCTGDTVTDVIEKLATELCTIIDQLDITNYDLSCFNITACPPSSFAELLQFLIEQICASQGVSTTGKSLSSGCPDCVVTMAPCFITGTQTTMQLVDYVNLIANRICSISSTITAMQAQIADLDVRVTILENAPTPTFTLPTITVDCTLQDSPFIGSGGPATAIDLVLDALINDDKYGYCALKFRTGNPSDIYNAIVTQCIKDGDFTLSNPSVTYGTEYFGSWIETADVENLADSITDIWIVLCDMYTAFNNITINVTDTTSVDLTYTGGVLSANVVDTGWVNLLNFSELDGGYYANNSTTNSIIPQCRRIGNAVYFRGRLVVPLASSVGGPPLPYSISTTTNTYIANTTVVPSQTGTGSVLLNAPGSVVFNNNANIIPSSVVGAGQNFDNSYISKYTVGDRLIGVDDSSTILTTVANIIITVDKKLIVQLVKDVEDTQVTGYTGMQGISTSPLNYLISHVTAGEYLPNFASASTNIHSGAASGTQPVTISFKGAPYIYPFSCDANDEEQLGGFSFILDGLTAYLNPCNTDIKSYICNDIGPVG